MSLESLHHPSFPFTPRDVPGEPEVLPVEDVRIALSEHVAVQEERARIIAGLHRYYEQAGSLCFADMERIINSK